MYRVAMHCTNCGHHWQGEFQKGERVPAVVECPRCACATGQRSWSPQRPQTVLPMVPDVVVGPIPGPLRFGDPPPRRGPRWIDFETQQLEQRPWWWGKHRPMCSVR